MIVVNKKYKNPPIIQSVCEFRFAESEWKSSYVGLCYEKLKKHYNKEEEVNTVVSGMGADQFGKVFNEIREVRETRFTNEKEKRSVNIGKSRLAIVKEKPYEGWESYKPSIINAFKAYHSVSSQKKIDRIGLRYINNINIKESTVNEDEYFTVYPKYTAISKNCAQYDLKMAFDCDNGDVMNVRIIPTASIEKEEAIFHLDFDYFTTKYKGKLNNKDIESWLKKAHDKINEYFENIITDKTRKLFD